MYTKFKNSNSSRHSRDVINNVWNTHNLILNVCEYMYGQSHAKC